MPEGGSPPLPDCSPCPRATARPSPTALRAQGRRPAPPNYSPCPRAAARPLAVHAASLRLGASARSPARPCRRPRAPQPPACRRGATPPTQASSPPRTPQPPAHCTVTTKHTHASSPPSGTAASHALHGHHQTRPGLVATLGHRRPRKRITQQTPPSTRPGGVDLRSWRKDYLSSPVAVRMKPAIRNQPPPIQKRIRAHKGWTG